MDGTLTHRSLTLSHNCTGLGLFIEASLSVVGRGVKCLVVKCPCLKVVTVQLLLPVKCWNVGYYFSFVPLFLQQHFLTSPSAPG